MKKILNGVLAAGLVTGLLSSIGPSKITEASSPRKSQISSIENLSLNQQAKELTKTEKRSRIMNSLKQALPLPSTSEINKLSKEKQKSLMKEIQQSKIPYYSPDRLIIKLKNGTTMSIIQKSNLLSVKNVSSLSKDTYIVNLTQKQDMKALITKLNSQTNVEYAEPDYAATTLTNDTNFTKLWGLKNTGQSVFGSVGVPGMDIGAEGAWAKTKGSSSLVVGVVDTGLDTTQADLASNIWSNSGEVANDGIDNDKNGYIDDKNGWDFYNNDKTVYDGYLKDDVHATHVAGTIAAKSDNNLGVVGVAPNVKIMPLKFLGLNGGLYSDAILAFNYAKAKGVKIYNNSWGGYGYSQALYDAMKSNGGLFVCAAGNDSEDNDSEDLGFYPASFDLSNIISVASINNMGELSWFSNYGKTSVDLAAPGEDILSTFPKDWNAEGYTEYEYLSGTSMATPHVTGAAALVASQNPSFSATSIKSKLLSTVKKLSSLTNITVTGGLLNAKNAVIGDDDIPGVPLSSTISGTLNNSSDKDDVFRVTLRKGEKITLNLTGATGTDFDLYLYGTKAKTVKINEDMVAHSEKAGSSTESIVYTAPSSGTYYVDVYSYSGSGSYTLTSKQGVTAGTYENTSSNIEYVGSWSTSKNSSASGGSFNIGNNSGTMANLVFNGTSIKLVTTKNSSQGIVSIKIDGGTASEVNLYSASSVYKSVVYTKTGLTSGRHTITVSYTGKAAPGSRKSSTQVNIDSFIVN
ncbi:S8 family serine peptidase [Gottfriedia sp. NPDC057991]|uniref:S8 family serine peptidase n=1 Tax=Gottfriedia sp. NPDC057991 TaxID=3346298 RepID=UPI0036DB63F7